MFSVRINLALKNIDCLVRNTILQIIAEKIDFDKSSRLGFGAILRTSFKASFLERKLDQKLARKLVSKLAWKIARKFVSKLAWKIAPKLRRDHVSKLIFLAIHSQAVKLFWGAKQ